MSIFQAQMKDGAWVTAEGSDSHDISWSTKPRSRLTRCRARYPQILAILSRLARQGTVRGFKPPMTSPLSFSGLDSFHRRQRYAERLGSLRAR